MIHRILYAPFSIGGGDSSNANPVTNTNSGGSQQTYKGGQITNPNSFAIGNKSAYVSPGSTQISGFKGSLTVQPGSGLDAATLTAILEASRQPAAPLPSPAPVPGPTLGDAVGLPSDPAAPIVAQTPIGTAANANSGVTSWLNGLSSSAKIAVGAVVFGIVGFFLWRRR